MNLNDEQISALNLLNSGKSSIVLKGYAGTGKTTTVTEWLKNRPKGRILLTAPTNKATSVLNEMCHKSGIRSHCCTTHSALGLNLKWRDGEQVLEPTARPGMNRFESADIVVIDECSMLNEELLGYVTNTQKQFGTKVIYMGDPAQLPPINEKISKSFSLGEDAELHKIMRQAGSSNIPQLGMEIRESLRKRSWLNADTLLDFVDNRTVSHMDKENDWGKVLDDFEEDQDIRFLGYRNATVQKAIQGIRERLYGTNCPELMPGEVVQALKPIKNRITEEIDHHTDSLITISEVKPNTWKDLLVWDFKVDGIWYMTVQGVHHTEYKRREDELRDAAKKERWRWQDFYDFVEAFAWIRPAQGMTIHKSQGSTFSKVFVDLNDVFSAKYDIELMKKLLYVGCSRPSDELVLLT